MTDITTMADDAFDALQHFADVWHDKYTHANGGENRKPPSLTMRAGGGTGVVTEPQMRAVVTEFVRMRGALERIGEAREEWAADTPGGWMQWPGSDDSERFARTLAEAAAKGGVAVELKRRVVGEWRAVPDGR